MSGDARCPVSGGVRPEASQTGVFGCPVRFECLAEALDNRIEWGVWGGMTERERRLLLRQRSDVTSWRSILVGNGEPAAVRSAGGIRCSVLVGKKCADTAKRRQDR